jgi:pimeloyl-ACP methyl ester carboxylesterase
MATDVEKFFVAQKMESAFVIGHSMGGKTAMQFALRFPQRVDKLIIEDIAPRAYEPAHDKIFAALLALDLKSFSTRQEMEAALAPEIPNLVLRRFLLKNLGRDEQGKFFWKSNLRGIAENYPALGEAISSPTPFAKPALFIHGEKSNYVKPEDEILIHQLFPLAKMEMIAGANHWVHGEKPDEFLRLVLDFL